MTTLSEESQQSTGSALVRRIRTASRRPASLGLVAPGVVSLAMGEPDGATPDPVVEAAVDALRAGRTHYAPATGSVELRDALAAHLTAGAGRPVGPEQVVVTHGGSAGLAAALMALVDPGDTVLVPEPTYSLYGDHLAMLGARGVWVPNTPDGGLDLDRIEAEAAGARLIVICNPVNPTGHVFGPAELDGLAGVLERHPHLRLLADEAYSDIVFDGLSFHSALRLRSVADQVVLSSTFSKSYAMTGWRLGYVVAPAALAADINLAHRTVNGALNTAVQDAAIVALATPAEVLARTAAAYQARRDAVLDALTGLPGLHLSRPQGAFYAFPRIDSPLSSDDMATTFARGGVLVRSGAEYGPSGEGHIRISFATGMDTLTEGLRRFVRVVDGITA